MQAKRQNKFLISVILTFLKIGSKIISVSSTIKSKGRVTYFLSTNLSVPTVVIKLDSFFDN